MRACCGVGGLRRTGRAVSHTAAHVMSCGFVQKNEARRRSLSFLPVLCAHGNEHGCCSTVQGSSVLRSPREQLDQGRGVDVTALVFKHVRLFWHRFVLWMATHHDYRNQPSLIGEKKKRTRCHEPEQRLQGCQLAAMSPTSMVHRVRRARGISPCWSSSSGGNSRSEQCRRHL